MWVVDERQCFAVFSLVNYIFNDKFLIKLDERLEII